MFAAPGLAHLSGSCLPGAAACAPAADDSLLTRAEG
jgi:hypothetical protein